MPFVRNHHSENRLSFTSSLRYKLNSRNNFSAGFILDRYDINYIDSVNHPVYDKFISSLDIQGHMGMIRGYAQWKHSFSNTLAAYAGIHTQFFTLNNEVTVEPRISLNWRMSSRSSLNIGYGLHSQVQPKSVYFFQSYDSIPDSYHTTNEELGMTKSHHLVMGYQHALGQNFRIKAETYYQHLFNVPVSEELPEFSLLNAGDFFGIMADENMINKGTGRNYGVELTIEKFLSKGYYMLFTTSLFDSKYTGYDGIERNTAFNGNYVFNLLGGYERKIGKNKVLTFDLKGVYAGGRRYIPIDVDESMAQGYEVRDWERAYENRYNDYFRTDLRIGLKVNGKRCSQEWAVDLQNITGYQSIFMEGIDLETGETYEVYQQGFYPMFLYRIQF